MNQQLSVLVYSKYSSMSKTLMDMIQTSGIDFETHIGLQSLCIDNKEIRDRIISNEQMSITTVPCLLIILPDGVIEKYDDGYAFKWFEEVILKLRPQPTEEEKWNTEQQEKQEMEKQEMEKQEMEKQEMKKQETLSREKIRNDNKKQYEEAYKDNPSQKHIKQDTETIQSGVTSIEDLPSDEEDEIISDRFRRRKPIGRIRSDQGNYSEGDELFQGPSTDMRKAVSSAVKGSSHVVNNGATDAKSLKSQDLMTRAKEMAKGREEKPAPPGHPIRTT
jgi:hypothetical protein